MFYKLGCQNTPAKGSRYCTMHKGIAREFVDDNENLDKVSENPTGNQDLLIVKIANEKSTRLGKLYEVIYIVLKKYNIGIEWN